MNRKVLSLKLFLTLLLFLPLISSGQTRRALLIGIDIYKPVNEAVIEKDRGGWTNLDGCKNDAEAIGEIIKARFGFKDENIATLYNQDAKRDRIIGAMKALIENSKKGDVVFIYYAGHGSQVYNSLSTEVAGDKQDESIVPADMIDIRDKELASLFNQLLDKGVVLTIIFDSCHSGSIARGGNTPAIAKTRHVNGNSVDALDPSDPEIPEDRGALVISAAQPEQLAKEALDDNGNPHGAFTVALIKALNSSSVNESAEVLFLRLKAIMQANGSTQEPVLGGNEERRKQGLFGEDLSATSGKTIIAVLKAVDKDVIELQGGWALGLNPGCELIKFGSEGQQILEITQVTGMARCKARLKAGAIEDVKAGDLYEIKLWASGSKPNLLIWYPINELSNEDIVKVAKNLSPLSTNKNFQWVSDPSKSISEYVIQFHEGKWKLLGPEALVVDLGKNPTPELVISKVPKKSSLCLQLPPSKEVISALQLGAGSQNSAIAYTENPLSADYILTGTYDQGSVKYAWIKPDITELDSSFLSTLPVRTDWFEFKNDGDAASLGDQLTQYAVRLGKINAWMNLSAPPDDGSFPFTLALKNLSSGSYFCAGEVVEGEQYSMVLQTTREKLKTWTGKSRYVYIFTIDVSGRTQQIFPFRNTGNEGNKIPNKAYEFETEIALGNVSFTISEPFGVDSYFLISSDEAINNFQAFNSDGVVTRGAGSGNPLENLINDVGVSTRGISNNTTPVNWGFQRIAITSKRK